jgi:hypothetical protein
MPEKNETTWLRIAAKFAMKTNFPNCLGAVEKLDCTDSEFVNYKNFVSVILMAVVDADSCFISVDIGSYEVLVIHMYFISVLTLAEDFKHPNCEYHRISNYQTILDQPCHLFSLEMRHFLCQNIC